MKNSIASNSIEKSIPNVVSMVISDAVIKRALTMLSLNFLLNTKNPNLLFDWIIALKCYKMDTVLSFNLETKVD